MQFRRSTLPIFVLLAVCFCPNLVNAQLRESPESPKSPNKAVRLSAIPTLASMLVGGAIIGIGEKDKSRISAVEFVGFGIWTAGVVYGPSLGYYYAGNRAKALKGILIRAGLMTGSTLIIVVHNNPKNRASSLRLAVLFGIVLQVATVGSAAHDILKVKQSARDYNYRHNLARVPRIQLTPIYLANQRAPGLEIRINL